LRGNFGNEESLRNLEFSADEENLLSGFGFLVASRFWSFNQADDKAGQPLSAAYQDELKRRGLEVWLGGKG
jgi:hypothetical protein